MIYLFTYSNSKNFFTIFDCVFYFYFYNILYAAYVVTVLSDRKKKMLVEQLFELRPIRFTSEL